MNFQQYLLFSIVVMTFYMIGIAFENSDTFSVICEQNEVFDPVSLECQRCPSNQTTTSSPANLCSAKMFPPSVCQCAPGFTFLMQETETICKECPSNHSTSTDGRSCIKCDPDDSFDADLKNCKPCPDGFISTDRDVNGTQLSVRVCIKCGEESLADPYLNKCVPCPPSFVLTSNKCQCPKATHEIVNGICVKLSELLTIPDRESSYLVDFTRTKVKSEFFLQHYRSAAHGCVFLKNQTACQSLANMCVLLHYSYDNELSACGYYRSVFGKTAADLPAHVPWIYYDSKEAVSVLSDTKIETVFSFQQSSPYNLLNVTLVKYSPFGELLNIGSAERVLDLCPEIRIHLKTALKFGMSFKSSCLIPRKTLWTDYDTSFYEAFLSYFNTEKQNFERYPVPVLNTDYKNEKVSVNKRGRSSWQLTRRFFLFDNLSGKDAQSPRKSGGASVVRYAKHIKLIVSKRKGGPDGLIYPPLLVLSYGEAERTSSNMEGNVGATLEVQYHMDFTDAKRNVSISAGVMSIFAVLWSLIEAYSWGKRSGKIGVDLSGVVKFLLIACGNLANVFFLVMFCSCLYWTVIFKRQGVVFLLLPSQDDEFLIKQYLISAFALKLVHLCCVLYSQMTVDLFLIDWEKPRAQNTIPHPKLSKRAQLQGTTSVQPISIWRIYFIANEWNEIQSLRKINLAYHLIAMLFFLKVLGVENHANFDPNSTSVAKTSHYQAQASFVCRFSLSISLYLTLIAVQLFVRSTVYERYIENKLQQFIDLCSMANISVFILENPLYGYYIHGRSVHGFADSDLLTFYEQLRREEDDLCAYRGLEASSDCQTFEVITTYRFREEYLRILTPTQQPNPPATSPQFSSGHQRIKLDSAKVELTVHAHEAMKNFFEMFLQHSSPEVDFVIKDKLFLETVLDIEFQSVEDKCLFFRDQKHLFDRVLLYGQESLLIVFEILLFAFVDLLSYDFVLSGVITFAVACVVEAVRNAGGKRNLIKKTLVDQRFLI